MTKCLRMPSAYVEVDDEEVEYLGGSWGGFLEILAGVAGVAVGAAFCYCGHPVAGITIMFEGMFTAADGISLLENA